MITNLSDHKRHSVIIALKKSTLILLFNLVAQSVFCQTVLKGRIVDSKADGIPYAHILVAGTQLGTYSNNEGFFILNIPSSYSPEITTISITSIGYVPLVLNINKNDLSHIRLDEDILELSAIEVVSVDYAKNLVLKGIQKIPNNYSSLEENYLGFTRETLFWNNSPRNPIYVAEAVIESSKNPYYMTSKSGNVKLIEGRRYVSQGLDSLGERAIGGVHHLHRFDVIARKEEFVSNPDRFYYDLIDTIRLNNSNIYEVAFSHKNQSKSGSIFIEESTFAITRVTIYYESGFPFQFHGSGRRYLKYEANYYKGYDDKWRLERTSYATAFKKRKGRLLNLVSEYATTEIKPFTEIPYIDRIQIGDAYVDVTGTYNNDFWNNYNIILPADSSEFLFKNKLNTHAQTRSSKKNTKKIIYNILSKMKLGYGFTVQNMEIRDYSFSYTNTLLEIQHAENSSEQFIWGFSSFFLYEFKPNTFIGLITESPITKSGITSYDLSISKDFNLNPNGRPIKIFPGLRFGYQKFDQFITHYSTDLEYQVNGKSFDSGKTAIFLTQQQIHFQPNMMFSIEKSSRISFYTSINYNLPFDRRIGLTFKEKNEFLFRKKQFLENGNEGLTINNADDVLLNSRINFNVGIFLTF